MQMTSFRSDTCFSKLIINIQQQSVNHIKEVASLKKLLRSYGADTTTNNERGPVHRTVFILPSTFVSLNLIVALQRLVNVSVDFLLKLVTIQKYIKSHTPPSTLGRMKKRTRGYQSKLSAMYEAGVREITVAYPECVQEEVPAAEFKTKVVGQSPPPQKGGPLSRCQIPTNTVIRGVYSILQSDEPKLDSQHETCKSDAQMQLKKDRPYECEHVLNRLFHQSQEQDGK